MAAVEVTITGLLYDKLNRTTQNVVLIGEATLTGLGVGGGPIIPPIQPPIKPPDPPFIWPNPPEGSAPIPSHPIALPGDPWWPPTQPVDPPSLPPPGSPPVVLPGAGPVHPITPPPAIVVDYPGVGKVLVPLPVTAT